MVLAAALALQQILFIEDPELQKEEFKKILYTAGGLFALLGIMYLMMDYSSPYDSQIIAAYTDQQGS